MPLYEYECECGRTLEALRNIRDRHNAICECGKVLTLKVSPYTFKFAHWFTAMEHDGQVLERRQTTERTPMFTSSGKEL